MKSFRNCSGSLGDSELDMTAVGAGNSSTMLSQWRPRAERLSKHFYAAETVQGTKDFVVKEKHYHCPYGIYFSRGEIKK